MKNDLGIMALIMLGMAQVCAAQAHAAELNRSCIKAYPQAKNDTDSTLIGLYQQLCEKSAKKNIQRQHQLNTQIAKRYVELGNNLKALNLIERLHQQNYHHQDLTDLGFLAGVGISAQNLEQMRSSEVRALNDFTYPQARSLTEQIYLAQPAPVFSEPVSSTALISKPKQAKMGKNNSLKQNVKLNKNKKTSNSPKMNTAVINTKNQQSITTHPFGSFKNN
ncbi:MAG: hypothetical protein ACN6NI_00075 [Acinetobacter sp.]